MTPKEFAKKIIASINPGIADISGIGDGTIKGAISEQNKNLGGLRFGIDGDGNYGYYGADDSLIPFKKVPRLAIDTLWYHRYGQITNITGLSDYTKFSWTSLTLSNAKNPIARFYDKNGTEVTSITMSASGGSVDISSVEKIYIYAEDNNSASQRSSINGVVIE